MSRKPVTDDPRFLRLKERYEATDAVVEKARKTAQEWIEAAEKSVRDERLSAIREALEAELSGYAISLVTRVTNGEKKKELYAAARGVDYVPYVEPEAPKEPDAVFEQDGWRIEAWDLQGTSNRDFTCVWKVHDPELGVIELQGEWDGAFIDKDDAPKYAWVGKTADDDRMPYDLYEKLMGGWKPFDR